MMRYVERTNAPRYLLLTECSMADNVAGANPDKEMLRLCSVRCPHMNEITLEDTLLAGAIVECFLDQEATLNDSARIAWDCFEFHGAVLLEALRCSRGGVHLLELGYEQDLKDAVQIDRHPLVPELRREPLRIEVGSYGIVRRRWPKP